MNNVYDEMRRAVRDARQTMSAADDCANAIADILLDGQRVRKLSSYRLKKLKTLLRDFNAHTQRWTK